MQIDRAVVVRPVVVLEEAGHDIDRPSPRAARHALRDRVAKSRRGQREIVDGALEKVAGERAFGKNDRDRADRRELRERLAARSEVRCVSTLGGFICTIATRRRAGCSLTG